MAIKRIGFIPLRKNSKGIPHKNKKKLLGRPLFTWVLTEAIFSNLDTIYVFTDDDEIISYLELNFKWTNKVKAIKRSDENASDTASTEAAMLEFASKIDWDFDYFCLLQATSPLTKREHINEALHCVTQQDYDSALSVVKTHRFIWDSNGKSLNYNIFERPRRQDFEGLNIENGAVYTTTKEAFKNSSNRISGNIATIEMPEETLTEIDSLSDWKIIEQLIINTSKTSKNTGRLNYLVLDVDGVFTDGRVTFGVKGELSKTFDMRDGMGLEILRQHNVQVIVMTSENSNVVQKRMEKLKIKDVYLGVKDKYSLIEQLQAESKIHVNATAYVGDDVNDLSNMLRVAWSFCPKNATKEIKYYADVVLNHDSANGAIREVSEFIINYNQRFE